MGKHGKGGGGDSHQRAMERASSKVAAVSSSPFSDVTPLSPVFSISERAVRIIESPSTQTLAGIVGGLVGTFLDGRYFAALGVWASFILYRSKALEGTRNWFKLCIHLLSVALLSIGLYYMGIQINKSRPHTYTPADYADAVKAGRPLPITQQITNIYKTEQKIDPPRPPQLSIDPPRITSIEGNKIVFNSAMQNVGGQTAKQSITVSEARFSESDSSTLDTDELFKSLYAKAAAKEVMKEDMLVGRPYTEADDLFGIPEQMQYIQSGQGKPIFPVVGVLSIFRDESGHVYHTEACNGVFFHQLPHPCNKHNRTY